MTHFLRFAEHILKTNPGMTAGGIVAAFKNQGNDVDFDDLPKQLAADARFVEKDGLWSLKS